MKRTELVKTLDLLKPALADNNMVPVFQCYMFNGSTVTATNDQIAIIANCKTEQPFAVKGDILLGLLSNSRAEDVTFTLETHEVVIKAARSVWRLPYFYKDDFLFEEPQVSFDTNLPLDADLLGGLQACLLTSSKDNTQPALMGVTVHKGVTLFSCDGDAVTRSKQRVQQNATPDRLLPNAFCEAVVKLVLTTYAKKGEFCVGNDWAMGILSTGHRVFGRVTKVDKPIDHEKLINDTLKTQRPQFEPIPKGLDNALSRARVVADPESGKTVLTVEGNRLKLTTETSVGVVRDSVPIGEHGPVTANVSAALVQRAISLCDQMALLDNCTAYRRGNDLFQLLSNMN
jgi:DNA polymerase III sliding clamp (beta) subunit (PCNA family)